MSAEASPSDAGTTVQKAFSPERLAFWWVRMPTRLQRFSDHASAAWSDGVYLTAWPRLGLLLPALSLALGLIMGATHWGFYIIGDRGVYSYSQLHPVSFAQVTPLVLLAAITGTLSAHLGFMLVLGYALGDLFWAGPPAEWTRRFPGIVDHLLHLTAPQLISYLVFFMLAALPALNTRVLLHDLIRRGKFERPANWSHAAFAAVSVALMAAVQGAFVYTWTFAAPMLIRIQWIWAGNAAAPVNITQFQDVTVPWLPLGVVIAFLIRCWLEYRVGYEESLAESFHTVIEAGQSMNWELRAPTQFRIGVQAALAASIVTLLSSGFLWSIWAGVAFFAILTLVFIVRAAILPRRLWWRSWARYAGHLPMVLRWAVAVGASYLLTRYVLSLGRFSVAINDKVASSFWVELMCIALGLVVTLILLPEGSHFDSTKAGARANDQGPEAGAATSPAVFFAIGMINFCMDPYCCFGASDLLAALMIAGLIWLMLPLILPLLGFALQAYGYYGALEAIRGKEFFTGRPLEPWERVLGLLPSSGTLRAGGKLRGLLSSLRRVEPGAVRGKLPLAELPLSYTKPGWPDLSWKPAKTFSRVEPVVLPEGTKLYRVIGRGNNPRGEYWSLDKPPRTEAEWRGGYAVNYEMNANGHYVEHTVGKGGIKVWKGETAPQDLARRESGMILPGGKIQIWMPRNPLIGVSTPKPTPWSLP